MLNPYERKVFCGTSFPARISDRITQAVEPRSFASYLTVVIDGT